MALALLHSPAEVIRQLLVNLGVGVAVAADGSSYVAGAYVGQPWPIFASLEPDQPDQCLTVYRTTPRQFGASQVEGDVLQHHGIQVRVRSAESRIGGKKADSIAQLSDNVVKGNKVTVTTDQGTAQYLVWSLRQTPAGVLEIGKDQSPSMRSLHTINFTSPIDRLS